MSEVRQEPPAPRAVRVCRICVDFLQSPAAAVEPCGHVFCHACIQPQAGPDAAATCPTCQGPIGGIRVLQGQESRAGLAPRRPRRRLHPFVVRWRQRQQRQQQQNQNQQNQNQQQNQQENQQENQQQQNQQENQQQQHQNQQQQE